MPTEDDSYSRAVVDAVHDMTRKVEAYTQAGDASRQQLQTSVEGIVAALRKDVHASIMALQLTQADHERAHEADRMERVTRQQQLSTELASIRRWMIIGLIGIGIALGVAAGIALGRWIWIAGAFSSS